MNRMLLNAFGLRSLQNVLRDIVFCLRPFVFLPSQEIRERRSRAVSRQLSPSPYETFFLKYSLRS